MAKEHVNEVLGGAKKAHGKKGKHKVHTMHIRKAHGGFVAQHEYEPPQKGEQPTPGEEHVMPDLASLQAHVGEHMGPDEEQGGGEPQPQAQPGA